MAPDAHAWEREHLGGATFTPKHNDQHPLDGKEPWRDRYARVGYFGETLKRGNVLSAKAKPGVGAKHDQVFVELHFASMADAEAYFADKAPNVGVDGGTTQSLGREPACGED